MYISVQKWGNAVLHRYIDSNGRDRKEEIKDFSPTLYIEAPDGEFTSLTDSSIRLGSVKQDDFASAKEWIEACEDRGLTVYGQNSWNHNAISDLYRGKEIHSNFDKIRVIAFDLEVESDDGFPSPIAAAKPIVSVSHYDSLDNKMYLYSLAPWDKAKSVLNTAYPELLEIVEFTQFSSEKDLLRAYLRLWTSNYPMVVTGWSSGGFDCPYLYNRMVQILGDYAAKTLSPFKAITKREGKDKFGNASVSVNIYGIAQLDLQDLYKKFEVRPRENHRLGTIAYVELNMDKIDYSEEETLQNLYEVDPQKFNDYNILDSWLVWKINEKRQFIQLAIYIAHLARANFDDVFSPVRIWDSLIYNYLIDHNKAPALPSRGQKSSYEGAFVKEPIPGMYRWVVAFDVASMHPTIMRQWNMCPSTVEDHPVLAYGNYSDDLVSMNEKSTNLVRTAPDNYSISANGVIFRQSDDAVFPVLIKGLFEDRKVAKKTAFGMISKAELLADTDKAASALLKKDASGFKTKEQAIKVLLNSFYGALANEYFRYSDLRMAEGITLTSKVIIQFIEKKMNAYLNKILSHLPPKDRCIAIDTDSNYFDLSDLVDKVYAGKNPSVNEVTDFLDKASESLTKNVIEPAIEEIGRFMGCRNIAITMKRESISDRGFWTAKKRYALNVIDNEGVRYAHPEQKSVGLQLVQTSTPKFVREKLGEAVKIILTGDLNDKERLLSLIDQAREEYFGLTSKELSYPRGVSELNKWKDINDLPAKGCPIQVRAALVYNYWLRKMGLENKYQVIKPGAKIRFLKLRTPNPVGSEIIGFYTRLPEEFGLESYIDKSEMFEGQFMSPLGALSTILGFFVEPDSSVEDFFS